MMGPVVWMVATTCRPLRAWTSWTKIELSRDVVHVHAFQEGDVHDEVHAVAVGAHAGQHLDVLGDAHHIRQASALFCVNVNGHVAEGNVRRVLTSLS